MLEITYEFDVSTRLSELLDDDDARQYCTPSEAEGLFEFHDPEEQTSRWVAEHTDAFLATTVGRELLRTRGPLVAIWLEEYPPCPECGE